MRNIILLLQNQADVTALPVASSEIKKLGTEGVWLLFSPTVLIDTATASREHDIAIRDIEGAMKDCAGRLDFEGAKNYKLKLDAAILDKAESVKSAYKRLSKEDQDAAYSRIFNGFIDSKPCQNIKVTQLSDHYEPANWIELLNSIKGAWFAPFTPGSFSVAWASSFVGMSKAAQPAPAPPPVATAPVPAPVAAPIPAPAPTPKAIVSPKKKDGTGLVTSTAEFKAILAMGAEGMGQEAIRLGINPSGMHRLTMAHALYRKKHGAVA